MLCVEIIGAPAGEEAQSPATDRPADELEDRTEGPDVEARVRSFLAEALGSIEAGEGPGTSLAAGIDVTCTETGVRVDLRTARPGSLIGQAGAVAERLRSGLIDVVGSEVALNIVPTE